MATLSEVRDKNVQWFSRSNKQFFGDRSYWVLHSRSGRPYLLRSTYQWSDMFGQQRKLSYRINTIDPETLKVGSLLDDTFSDREQAKRCIRNLA